jgi:hypothetical protein
MPRYAILLFSPIDAITPLRHYAITPPGFHGFRHFAFRFRLIILLLMPALMPCFAAAIIFG